MRVTAYDSLSPSKVATSTVIITVIRNPSPPQFTLPSYEVTIPETYSLGQTVVNVTAIDPDGVSLLSLIEVKKNQQLVSYSDSLHVLFYWVYKIAYTCTCTCKYFLHSFLMVKLFVSVKKTMQCKFFLLPVKNFSLEIIFSNFGEVMFTLEKMQNGFTENINNWITQLVHVIFEDFVWYSMIDHLLTNNLLNYFIIQESRVIYFVCHDHWPKITNNLFYSRMLCGIPWLTIWTQTTPWTTSSSYRRAV